MNQPLQVGKSKGHYYAGIQCKGSDNKPFFLPIYGPYKERAKAQEKVDQDG